jgi:hypothetical protein
MEQQLEATSDRVDQRLSDQHDAMGEGRGRVTHAEAEYAVVVHKNNRELSKRQCNSNQLKLIELRIRNFPREREQLFVEWRNQLKDTKAKYRDAVEAIQSARERALQDIKQVKLLDKAAEAAEAKKAGKKKGTETAPEQRPKPAADGDADAAAARENAPENLAKERPQK